MDYWNKAMNLASEKTQNLTIGSSKLSDLVSDATKLSKDLAEQAQKKSIEIAEQAHKKSIQIANEATKRAEEIRAHIPAHIKAQLQDNNNKEEEEEIVDEEKFGVTEDLRDFVKGITANTFRDFPLQDDSEVSNIPTVSNVRQDLTAWQEKHAKIVLSTVKEISKLRYELCPRAMKERKFWRIYFILVNSHVSPYEMRYTEEAMLKSAEVKKEKIEESSASGTLSKPEAGATKQKSKANEQDLDVFLLGDLGESDDGRDDGVQDFDDDFDKL